MQLKKEMNQPGGTDKPIAFALKEQSSNEIQCNCFSQLCAYIFSSCGFFYKQFGTTHSLNEQVQKEDSWSNVKIAKLRSR